MGQRKDPEVPPWATLWRGQENIGQEIKRRSEVLGSAGDAMMPS